MSKQDHFIESLVSLVNTHFQLQIERGAENIPIVLHAEKKNQQSITQFTNQLIQLIEHSETEGKLNYYFGNELDFDTPEEMHRH